MPALLPHSSFYMIPQPELSGQLCRIAGRRAPPKVSSTTSVHHDNGRHRAWPPT